MENIIEETFELSIEKGHAIAFDFDGVIHKYSKGWQDGSIYDEANEDVLALIRGLMLMGCPCVVISTREPRQIKEWWDKHIGIKSEVLNEDTIFFNDCSYVGITNRKLPAQVYIDDRGLRYTGQNLSQLFREFAKPERVQEVIEWIPIKTKPATEDIKNYYPDAEVMFDCELPDDGDEVLVQTIFGVGTDIFCNDDYGCGGENYDDWSEVIAWARLPKGIKKDVK